MRQRWKQWLWTLFSGSALCPPSNAKLGILAAFNLLAARLLLGLILISLVIPSCLSFPYWTGVSGPENLYVFRMYSLIECLGCVTGLPILRFYCGLSCVNVLGINLPWTKTSSSSGIFSTTSFSSSVVLFRAYSLAI